jgi:subtilisin family serine protease
MKRPFTLLHILFFVFISSTSAQNFINGEIHMKTVDTLSGQVDVNNSYITPLLLTYGIDTIYYPFTGLNNDTLEKTCRIKFSNYALTSQLLAALEALPICDYAEPSPLYTTDFTPNDVHANQWHLSKIQATGAWDVSQGSQDVVIAIIDNGVRTTHEDLAGNLWVNAGEIAGNGFDDDFNGYTDDRNGYDVADRDGNPNPPIGISSSDAFNHGTHCAGIASAVTNNNKGIASVAFKAKIMAVKCTRNNEAGNVLSASMDGVTYAMRNNADIISMSFGSNGNSITSEVLFNTARSRGITLIAAAGNDNVSTPFYPASYPGVISVGASDQNDVKAGFSNFGSTVDLMAPGVAIFSTLGSSDTDYGSLSGTSMACPLVASLAGLVLAARPNFTPQQVEATLKNNIDDISALNTGFNGQLGAGRINALKTLDDFSSVNVIDAEENNNGAVKIFPNPFNETLRVNIENYTPTVLEIYNLEGKLMERSNIQENNTLLNVEHLLQGAYVVKVFSEENMQQFRLVKF